MINGEMQECGMKILLTILSGFALTLMLFAGGAVTAVYFLSAEPVPVRAFAVDTDEVWTNEPVQVDTAEQEFDRLPPSPAPQAAESTMQAATEAEPEDPVLDEELVDMTTTAAVPPPSEPQPEVSPAASAQHVAWCSERYRSYRPGENAYTAYSGEKRECVSPYSDVIAAAGAPVAPDEEGYDEASLSHQGLGYAVTDDAPTRLSMEHVRSCFDRYRSYRVEDNTYQPYGGGPRRQCE
jgi:hypothetical protein